MRFLPSKFASGLLAVILTFSGAGISRADEALKRVQQSLRDQGFYYGAIDGSPGDETTQAIRRYQIRNGLAVTGQLTDETRNSIARTGAAGSGASTAARGATGSSPARPPATAPSNAAPATRPPSSAPAVSGTAPGTSRAVPAPTAPPVSAPVARNRDAEADPGADEPDYRLAPRQTVRPPSMAGRGAGNNRDEEDDEEMDEPAPQQLYRGGSPQARPDLRADRTQPDEGNPPAGRYGSAPSATLTALFERTPYEFAPPAVQAEMVRRAQMYLIRNGFYDGPVTGNPGARTSEAIANFQQVSRLRPTARLDVSTLGLMRLLPGRQTVEPRYERPRQPRIIFEGRISQ